MVFSLLMNHPIEEDADGAPEQAPSPPDSSISASIYCGAMLYARCAVTVLYPRLACGAEGANPRAARFNCLAQPHLESARGMGACGNASHTTVRAQCFRGAIW